MNKLSRRRFIGDSVKGAAAVSLTGGLISCSQSRGMASIGKMPMRVLGKTGLEVSVLSFGGGSMFIKNPDGDWEKLMEQALSSGINLFDTSPTYSEFKAKETDLGSEEKFARILSAHRDSVLISTKIETRNPAEVRAEVKASLERLNTDYVDILMLHALNDEDNVDDFEKGVYREMQSLKKAGMARYIGFSSMGSARRSKEVLERMDIDVALLALNATQYGSYAELALPAARKQNTGVIAMKIMRNLVGEAASAEELFKYGLSLEGVASLVVGHIGTKQLKDNVQLAQEFGKTVLNTDEKLALETRLAGYAGPHQLCWARPDYVDGMDYLT